jgi:hypothetical protein
MIIIIYLLREYLDCVSKNDTFTHYKLRTSRQLDEQHGDIHNRPLEERDHQNLPTNEAQPHADQPDHWIDGFQE